MVWRIEASKYQYCCLWIFVFRYQCDYALHSCALVETMGQHTALSIIEQHQNNYQQFSVVTCCSLGRFTCFTTYSRFCVLHRCLSMSAFSEAVRFGVRSYMCFAQIRWKASNLQIAFCRQVRLGERQASELVPYLLESMMSKFANSRSWRGVCKTVWN